MATLNASPNDFWADVGLGEPYVRHSLYPEPREYGPIYFDAVLPVSRYQSARLAEQPYVTVAAERYPEDELPD